MPRKKQDPWHSVTCSSLRGLNFVALDFETASYSRNSVCAIGMVKVVRGVITERLHRLVRPPSREFRFTHIHGISWASVAHSPSFPEVWELASKLLRGADFVAAHNAAFDRSVMAASCLHAGVAVPSLPFSCTLRIARQHFRLNPAKLPDVCRHLGIQLQHHNAGSDAAACAQIVIRAEQDRLGAGA